MSRLDEEYLLAVVRNRSGIDSGEIDYSIPVEKFERQRVPCLKKIITTLHQLEGKCLSRIAVVEQCEHDFRETPNSREHIKFYRCSKCNVSQ